MSDADILIEEFSETITITRYDPDGYYDGPRWVGGSTSTFDIEISLQPLNGRELMYLPEAQRSKRSLKGYTTTELQTVGVNGSNQKADSFTYQGTDFEIYNVKAYKGEVLNHYKILAIEKNSL